ncbi:allantoicase [Frateuria aurantia]
MSHGPVLPQDAPEFARRHLNLADARLGARALACSDDFFAPMDRMLQTQPAIFIPGQYDAHGKWMDGWESRRRRNADHDWCVVRLARAGTIRGVDLDTSHFTGNFPPAASIEGCLLETGDPGPDTVWHTILPTVALSGNQHHYHPIEDDGEFSHLRVHLWPDGGLARLRIYGLPRYTPDDIREDGLQDLASALLGGRVVACNNQHFGAASQLLVPDRGQDMGDGWETRRRREPGHDWCIIALARPGLIEEIEVDTAFFKGNYPDRCSLHGAYLKNPHDAALVSQAMFWPSLLGSQPLGPDAVHRFRPDVADRLPVSHVRFDIHPDGGVSRLRLWGRPHV